MAFCLCCHHEFTPTKYRSRALFCDKPKCQKARYQRYREQVKKAKSKETLAQIKARNDALKKPTKTDGERPWYSCQFKGCMKNAYPNIFYCKKHHHVASEHCAPGYGGVYSLTLEEERDLLKYVVKLYKRKQENPKVGEKHPWVQIYRIGKERGM